MVITTVYVFWSGFAERVLTIRYASGAVAISAAFGAAWLTRCTCRRAAYRDVCDERHLGPVAGAAAADGQRPGALVAQPPAAHVMKVIPKAWSYAFSVMEGAESGAQTVDLSFRRDAGELRIQGYIYKARRNRSSYVLESAAGVLVRAERPRRWLRELGIEPGSPGTRCAQSHRFGASFCSSKVRRRSDPYPPRVFSREGPRWNFRRRYRCS